MWIKSLELTRERRWTSYLKSILKPWPARVERTLVESDKPIRVVFVGMGRHAQRRFLPAISGIAGFSVESAVVRWNFPAPPFSVRCTTNLDEELLDPKIQAAVVSVPTSIIAQISALCLASGMHVYSECPAALSAGDLRLLERASARGGHPVFQVGYQLRALPDIRTLAGRLRSSPAWTLDVSFHSIYHLCDLMSFLAGSGRPQSVRAISRNELKLVFSSDRVVRMTLAPGPLVIRAEISGIDPIVLEIGSGAEPENYRGGFLNFESAVRGREPSLCSLADLENTLSIYSAVRFRRLIRTP